ncbi:AAA family ATPase [Clostridium sediminicola]|uniref:AAA family ATPase n=1 Tax=Clostridium sediminicola TaxID=3114879 RepID=UPI0031F1FB15
MNKEEHILKTLIQNKVVGVKEFLDISIKIVEALDEIHKKKIIHLDLNPENIFINLKGKIRIADIYETIPLKRSGLAYIAPEQTGRIYKKVDYRADYYSLGICFYELLIGETPFKNMDNTELVYSHLAIEAIDPDRINTEIPKVVSDIIMKLISKMPEDRYQSLKSLKKDLNTCKKSFDEKGNIEFFQIANEDMSNIFEIPDKLYGRNKEINELLRIFKKVKKGNKELVLIKGYPGIGKSSLVKEINNSVVKENAYFIGGKFQQFKNNTPYSAIISALKYLIKDLLKEPADKLKTIREKILKEVGNNGRVITDIIPSLKLIIGEQNPITELGIIEAQNRFNLVFQNFMSVISSEDCPIVMFIDDLQWADPASINFIQMLMENKAIKNLLIIGTYRDNKTILEKPLESMINVLHKKGIITNKISLNPLNEKDIRMILKDTLIETIGNEENLKELSCFVYEKTGGNPFFTRQFLGYLYNKEYIWFHYELMKWCWNIEEIKKQNITENVVELLVGKIKILRPKSIEILKLGACIGNTFSLTTIAMINKKPKETIQKDLQQAINEGLIFVSEKDNGLSKKALNYRFLHDRIQQAVYSMIPDSIKDETHLSLARLLWENQDNREEGEGLFQIVGHYNAGRNIINNQEEKIKLAELNLKASKMAKKSSSFDFSFLYLKTGIELLGEEPWSNHYQLALELYSNASEGAYLISDYEMMEFYCEEVLKNAKSLIDKIKIYTVKIEAYQAQMKLQEALKTGISTLELMGVDIPHEPDRLDVDKAFESVSNAMEGIKIEDLENLPEMKDPLKLAAMEILLGCVSVTYKAAPLLTPIVVCKMVELSIKYGNTPFSAGVYVSYGMIICTSGVNIELGYKLGKLSMSLVKNRNLNGSKTMVFEIYNYCIIHWKEHISSSLNLAKETYRTGIENGSLEYGGYALNLYTKNAFYAGQPLEKIGNEIYESLEKLQKIKQGLCENWVRVFGQLVLNMQGKSQTTTELVGIMCDERKLLPKSEKIGDMISMAFIYLTKLILNYCFEEYDRAVKFSEKAEENLDGIGGTIDTAIYRFFDSLARLQVYQNSSKEEKKNILQRVEENQIIMRNLSEHAPMNFLHKYYLVEAELLRIKGERYKALEYYNKSITLAKENNYINEEALANELAAKFWIQNNKPKYAKLHFEEAYEAYQKWGAVAKLNHLKENYGKYIEKGLKKELSMMESAATSLHQIDLITIMKASEVISQEIVLDELIKRLIFILSENVGAQKVVIIMKKEERFIIKGIREANENKITIVDGMDIEVYSNIPKNIINYVARSKETVIIKDANNSVIFANDSYISNKKPKSVLCSPLIKGGELQGIIYLENNLMTGAFTEDRLKVLEMLSSQIAISIENAKLFEVLEEYNEILEAKVVERTIKLEEEKNKLQKYLNLSKAIFMILNEKGEITTINKRGYEVLGDKEVNILGKNLVKNYIVEVERKKSTEIFYSKADENRAFYTEGTFITCSGEKRKYVAHNDIINDEHGNIESILISALDITEIELLREELQYNKLKIEFFANLSHELKTPLNLSFSALQMLDLYNKNYSMGEGNEKFQKYINIIKQNNYRLLKLVNNIVDITKINANHFNIDLENLDIVDIAKKITYSVSDYCNNKERIVKFNSLVNSKLIACDAFSIERIMLNLFSNAVKCTNEGDEISVNIYEKENFIVITVKDTGTGIPEDRQKVIFDRFRQVDKSFTRRSEGSGLGLTIVKLLLELQGGTISVNSELGKFTEFTIELPIRVLNNESSGLQNGNTEETNFIDVLDIEFSDVYGL